MTGPDDDSEAQSAPGVRGWVLAIIAICVLWLAAMVTASYYGFETKTPVRIEGWQPVPAAR